MGFGFRVKGLYIYMIERFRVQGSGFRVEASCKVLLHRFGIWGPRSRVEVWAFGLEVARRYPKLRKVYLSTAVVRAKAWPRQYYRGLNN